MVRKITWMMMALGVLLSSCTQATVESTTMMTPPGVLTPFITQTATAVKPTATYRVTVPITPSPTPTPFLHTITDDDTMFGLAIHYGIELKDLEAANPEVNPNAMTVGSQLVIPINVEIPQAVLTPTPVPVNAGQPSCIKSGDGGAWCLVALRNELETSLENLSVWIGLYTPQGENFTSQVAYTPLNILRPGSTMPVMAYFSPPLPDEFTGRSEVVSALEVARDDTRYMEVEVRTNKVEINHAGSEALVNGEVILPDDKTAVSQVWVLVVAYDEAGNIIGARKWKSAGVTQFNVTVYSLGSVIDHVDVLSEVRP